MLSSSTLDFLGVQGVMMIRTVAGTFYGTPTGAGGYGFVYTAPGGMGVLASFKVREHPSGRELVISADHVVAMRPAAPEELLP